MVPPLPICLQSSGFVLIVKPSGFYHMDSKYLSLSLFGNSFLLFRNIRENIVLHIHVYDGVI